MLAACQRAKVPIVQSFHLVPDLLDEGADAVRLKDFSREALRAASAITFPSTAVKQGFQEISPEARRAQIIRGGVNLEYAVTAMPFRRQRPYIFSASRLDLRHKAVDVLIAAFELVATEFPGVDLLIAGDGPHRARIEDMIGGCNLESRIQLLPALPHDELWSLYRGALVFVMLSRMAEGLPLVFFEAMACGTSVIGTRSGGTPEIVIHEETGLLVEGNEPGPVAAAMRALLANPDKRESIGRRGSELARLYDWKTVAAGYLALYRDVLAMERGR